jgi:3-isopropylmalate dehydrogenase
VFGDNLCDNAAMMTGSIGMLLSASLGYGSKGLYEPVHGTAPDIARIDRAVRPLLRKGYRTPYIFQPGDRRAGTEEMGDAAAAARQSAE